MRFGKTIYFDHQSTTRVDARVLAEMTPYFAESFGNPHSSDHCLGWESAGAVEAAAARVAQLIGADPDEITFTSGATESNNLALLGLGRGAAPGKRRRVLISAIEHKSVLAVARVLQRDLGFMVEELPVDSEGRVVCAALERAMNSDVFAVSIMAVNNEIGTIQDIKRISAIVRSHGALFHCDGAQAPIAIEIGYMAEHTDLFSLTAHKMYGPKGIGALYVSRELKGRMEPIIYGGNQQDGLRSGTVPVPLCVGFGLAAEILGNDDATKKRIELRRKRDAFIDQLRKLPYHVKANGPRGHASHPGNASICFVGFSAHDILNALQPHVAASTGSACTSGTPEPSHVLKAIGLSSDQAESSIRFSLGFGTSDAEVEEVVTLLEETLAKLSKAGLQRRES